MYVKYINESCRLCFEEKLQIETFPEQDCLLNKKSKLVSKYKHKYKFLPPN